MTGPVRRLVRTALSKTHAGSLWLWKRDRRLNSPAGRPDAQWWNAVLRSQAEADGAVEQVRHLRLPVMTEYAKNWDSLAALDLILRRTTRAARILDAGSEKYSMILPWLALYGYRNLVGCNLVFDAALKSGPIRYEHGDITALAYRDSAFDAVTCLSVIEHGVDLRRYFAEMSRVLKPGGLLITSTDYFDTPIDTGGQHAYGAPIHIFTKEELRGALATAGEYGFETVSPLDLSARDRVVAWPQYGLRYTFAIFSLTLTAKRGR